MDRLKGLCTASLVQIRLDDAATYYSPPHYPFYDSQPLSHAPSTSELGTLKLSRTLSLHRHSLIHIQRVSRAAHTSAKVVLLPRVQSAIDEVGSYHPGRLIDETDVGGVVLDVAVKKGFAGTVGG